MNYSIRDGFSEKLSPVANLGFQKHCRVKTIPQYLKNRLRISRTSYLHANNFVNKWGKLVKKLRCYVGGRV